MAKLYWILLLATLVAVGSGRSHPRRRRSADVCVEYCDVDPEDRNLCPATPENTPPNRVNSTDHLLEFRTAMRNTSLTGGHLLDVYLVYEGSYYGGGVTEHDRRMQWISGFSGSSGHVIVTYGSGDVPSRAALWTDGRYWLAADQEMDCNWIMMKDGATGTPSSVDWLLDILPAGAKVGVDAEYIDTTTWQQFEAAFAADPKGIQLMEVPVDLFDYTWTEAEGRPAIKSTDIYEHTIEYAGKPWQDKLNDTRNAIAGTADVLIVTLLDDIAWLLNMRAADRDTSPLFDSVAAVEQNSVRLYIRDPLTKLPAIQTHLNTGADGTCTGQTGVCVEVRNYDDYLTDIAAYNANPSITKIWINIGVAYAVYQAAGNPDASKRHEDYSPIQLPKSQKNPTEVRRYRECQIRDSAIVAEFISILEREVQQGAYWSEMTADQLLTDMRAGDPDFRMVSFFTISAFGTNGAVIHYRASEETNKQITTDNMYLLDSGGNYLDATTDVTRTFHFGQPTAKNIEVYTRVLLGVIDLATTVWPFGWKGSDIDARTRAPIWEKGWDFNHGTGHGIGYFLNVHEGPGRIAMGYDPAHEPLHEHMYFSDEPGIYLDGEFGVRLETIVEVVIANTTYKFNDKDYMTFDPVTFVPFEPHLIDYNLLETHHRVWLNKYHKKCNETTGQYLLDLGKQEAYDWLVARTAIIPEVPTWGYAVNSNLEINAARGLNGAAWLILLTFIVRLWF